MIVLIRHGEATHHTENLTGGWTDSLLTAKGESQLSVLADRLRYDFAKRNTPAIYTSDLRRAARSAEIIGQALGVKKINKAVFLREKNNGKAANISEEQAKHFFRLPPSEQALDHANYEGGETRRTFYNRVVAGMKQLSLESRDIILVAHKGSIQNIIFWWLGFTIDEVVKKNFSVDIRPASVTVLGINKWHEHAIFLLNDTSYAKAAAEGFGFSEFKK